VLPSGDQISGRARSASLGTIRLQQWAERRLSCWVSLADTLVAMPLVMLVGAVAVIVLLMVVGMRQCWEPEIPPTFGTGPQPPPPPRFYGVLAIVGISLVVIGGLLGALLHSPGLIFVGLAAYTATWIVRHILLLWGEAENRWMRAAAVARPVSVVVESHCPRLPDLCCGSSEEIRYLRELIESGAFKPVIDRRYSLEQIVEAYRYVETGRKIGNVVITVVPSD
jgi:hypothetical protein